MKTIRPGSNVHSGGGNDAAGNEPTTPCTPSTPGTLTKPRAAKPMRFLFDLQHPAHLHFFRNAALRLREEGHEVRFTGRDKDILVQLANEYGLEIEVFGVARKGAVRLGCELLYRQWRLRKIIKAFRPDAIMAIAGTFVSSLGKWMGVPVYIFYDTEHATISNLLAYPFASCIYTPRCYRKSIRWRHIRYNGYHELAYLHPRYFTPDPSVLEEAGLQPDERFALMRFVAWEAAHDMGRSGFSAENKLRAVNEFKRYDRVMISCEGELPPALEPYRLRLPVSRIHHLMAYTDLIFGESATMCSEGAVLGAPGIFLDPLGRGYTDEQEREYGLVFNFTSNQQEEAIRKGVEILADYRRGEWRDRGAELLSQKIDVTDFICRVALERPFAEQGRGAS